MEIYRARAEAVRHAEMENDMAYATCPAEGLESPTIVGAQVANELLNITGIKASFVFTRVRRLFMLAPGRWRARMESTSSLLWSGSAAAVTALLPARSSRICLRPREWSS